MKRVILRTRNSPFECQLDDRFSLLVFEESNTNDKIIPELVHRNVAEVPLLENMPSGHSINRLFVLVDYANKLSPT